ncbi:apolipoprotein N-acyltransferase [Paracoccaceae bacterium Fryx2]|nr:apolipoprotein N-acyltransferase [Paracoccaceae bacterium Fryx2]
MIASPRRWSGPVRTGAAFGLGAVMAAGQAPLEAWWLTLPALSAVIWLITMATGPRPAFRLGLFAGAGYFAAALNWIIEPFLIDVARHGWMAPFAVVLLAFGLGLFWAAAAALAHLRPFGGRALAVALTLTTAEMLRGTLFTGFPWALIGHVWIGTPVAQVAALAGPDGLTLLTTLAAALPVALGPSGLGAGAVLVAAATCYGLWHLDAPGPSAASVTLRLVQPNAEQHLKWDADRARVYFERQLAYTAALPRPDLTIWPETAVPYLLENAPGALAAISIAAADRPVVVGIQRTDGWRGFNSMAVVGPGGLVTGLYDKHHLVPFGEYIPFGDLAYDLLGLRAFAAQEGNGYSAGVGAAVLDLGPGLGTILPLICYEAVFPQDIRSAPSRPDWILQITNDAWFGTLTGPYQHLAQARLRAIEQGLPLVRVANTGVSAVIDAQGRITAQIPLGEAAFLDATLPAALPATPFSRLGQIPVWLLLAGLAAVLLIRRVPARP